MPSGAQVTIDVVAFVKGMETPVQAVENGTQVMQRPFAASHKPS